MTSLEKAIAPEYKVEINGLQLSPDLRSLLTSVQVIEEINIPSMFSIVFQIGGYEEAIALLLELEIFHIGSEVKVYMGSHIPLPLITGEITSIEPSLHDHGSQVEIRGYDRLHKLKLGKRTKTYQEIKDSDLVMELASNWGLQGNAEITETVIPHLYQNNRSDFDLLEERAARLRFEFSVDDKILNFTKSGEAQTATTILEYGADFTNFKANYRAVYQGDQVDVKSWDYKNKELIEASAKAGQEISKMEALETGVDATKKTLGSAGVSVLKSLAVDKDEAEAIALAEFNRNVSNSVKAVIRLTGNPELRRSKTVKLIKLNRYSGTYYIYKAEHTLNTCGYYTEFHARRTGL